MIAIDTSSWIAFLAGSDPGDIDVEMVSGALTDHQACLPPVVLTELLGDPKLPSEVASLLVQLLRPEVLPDFWQMRESSAFSWLHVRHCMGDARVVRVES